MSHAENLKSNQTEAYLTVIQMTIHDELVLKLINPDPKSGKPRGYIINIVGSANITYMLEKHYLETRVLLRDTVHLVEMTPDIVVTDLKSGKTTAIEIENDIQWDFADSLRQVKKYRENRREFQDVVVIIPKKYERFAILYKNEGFRVYLWKSQRKWQCLRCEEINVNESRIPPKCEGEDSEGKPCTNRNRNEFDLVGLEGVHVYEYE